MKIFNEKKYEFPVLLCCGAILLVLIVKPWNLYFLNDDFEHIPIPNEKLILRNNFLRPVPNFFLLCDRWLYDKQATGYFITTIVLHIACVCGVYLLSKELIKKFVPRLPYKQVAIYTALFFLFYPFHAEPMFWIIARGSIIAAAFSIFSIHFYLRKNDHTFFFFLSWFFFTIALFTYESVWNVLAIFSFISWLNTKNFGSSKTNEYMHAGIMLLTFMAYLGVRYASLHTLTGGYESIDKNITNIPLLVLNLLKLTGRNFTPPLKSNAALILFFCVSVILYFLIIIAAFKKNKAAGWFLSFLCIGMITALITATPFGIDTHTNEGERFIYYSSFYYCLFVTTSIFLLSRKVWQLRTMIGLIIVSVLLLSHYQSHFQYASTVSKATVESIAKYPNYRTAFFIDVPDKYRGAVIFRTGLPFAIRWMNANNKIDSIHIFSKTPQASGILPFKREEVSWDSLSAYKEWKSFPANYAIDSTGKSYVFDKSSLIFWYRKDGLYKVNTH